MKVRFLTLARQELDDAVAWYNEQVAGLGYDFLDELDRAVRRIRRVAVFFEERDDGGSAVD